MSVESTIRINKSLVAEIRRIKGSNDTERIITLLSEYNKRHTEDDKIVQILQSNKIVMDNVLKEIKEIKDIIYSKSGY